MSTHHWAEAGRVVATYRLRSRDPARAEALALAIAREQTLEVPPDVGGRALQRRLLGHVEGIVRSSESRFDATISYSLAVTGTELLQVVNVAYGNVSLMNGVRLIDLRLPPDVLDVLPGPRFGIDGVRKLARAGRVRPLVGVALKPVGLTTPELATLAERFVLGGADVIKDDHGLGDQGSSPFRERVAVVAAAVASANAATGGSSVYFPNVTGPLDTLEERLGHAEASGCAGVVMCPALMGLDVMRVVASGPRLLAIMAHPAHSQTAPGRREGISPRVLYGTLYRAAGADVVVYVNAGGRFAWPAEACEAINDRLRSRLGRLRPALPAPAGGLEADEAAYWLERYGPDTMLLIGGSLLKQDDIVAATRRLVEVAAAS